MVPRVLDIIETQYLFLILQKIEREESYIPNSLTISDNEKDGLAEI